MNLQHTRHIWGLVSVKSALSCYGSRGLAVSLLALQSLIVCTELSFYSCMCELG